MKLIFLLKKWAQKNYRLTNPVWRLLWKLIGPGHKVDSGFSNKEKSIFDNIYARNSWGSSESVSGPGSELIYTANIRNELPKVFQRLGINSMLDAPCGDCNWIKKIKFPDGFIYMGGDIVKDLTNKNKNLSFDSSSIIKEFFDLDITRNELPSVDAWLCRDVLFHLSNDQILSVLNNFNKSNISYLITTYFSDIRVNHDITAGGYRPLNLTDAPFLLPKPILSIDDFIIPYPPRYLAIWSKTQLASLNFER